jgi:molybdopterin-guanine dinucleotide biosynthesis protein A
VTPTGVVLTGGASRRMGSDKAVLLVDGVAMAVRVAAALSGGGCDPIICQGGDAVALAALGLAVAPDSRPGDGPVIAIRDALTREDGDLVICACDLPWLDATTVTRLVGAAGADPSADVVVACDADGPHLAAFWRARAREQLELLVAQGVRSYRAVLGGLRTVRVEVPPAVVANVNKPEDLRPHR